MTDELAAAAPTRGARSALRARLAAIAPDGLLWLDSKGLAHPEAKRATRLPFAFVIGRIERDGRRVTVRETELVLQAAEVADDREALESYACFVIAQAPTVHARLTGRVAAAWIEAQA